jgi:uncharacterized protein Yka (UPF0111/DUF47 family)
MNRNSLLNVFAPKYSFLFPYFENYTRNLILAAEQLRLLTQTVDPQQQNLINRKINELHNKGYNLACDICSLIDKLFIIPFDREDINELVIRVGEFLEYVTSTVRMIHFSGLSEIYAAYVEMADINYQASIETDGIIKYLGDIRKNRSYIILGCENLNILENRAKEVFYSELLNIIVANENIAQVTKTKNILESFMKCSCQTNSTVEIIRSILRKSS